MKKVGTLLLFLILSCTALPLKADWPCATDTAVPAAIAPGNQWNVQIASDCMNGAVCVWQDRRGGTEDKLYVQRLSAGGNPLWAQNGIPLAVTGGFQYYPQIISDGSGGAFVAWQDDRNASDYDIYAQHISPAGNPLWTLNGVPVCTAAGHQYNPQLASDGQGGIYVTWQDKRSGQFDVYVQHIGSAGNALLAVNGIPACAASNDQINPVITSDGLNGAVIAWTDFRSGTGFSDVYAQRILASGQTAWQIDGVPVCQATNTQWNVRIAPDGGSNVYVVWQDRRNGTYDNIYAQLLDLNGNGIWGADGLAVAPFVSIQYYPQVSADPTGGITIAWQDNRTGTDYDIYAQRVSKAGQLLWNPTGLPVCTAAGNQYYPQVVSQNGSSIVVWQDRRNGTDYDIFGARISIAGQMLWPANGAPVSNETLDQYAPVVTSDGQNGIVAAWSDYHTGITTTDISTLRIGANGLPAGGCYRSITQAAYGTKAIRPYNRSTHVTTIPNEGNVRDTIFRRGAFANGLYLGYQRLDNTKQYAWEMFTTSFFTLRALPQYGTARPLDQMYGRLLHNVLRNPSVTRYNNRLSGELMALKLNIAMSDEGLTTPNFGDIVFHDTAAAPNVLNDRSLRQITALADSVLTYWRGYNGFDYASLANWLSRINAAFSSTLDTLSVSPLRLTAPRALFSVPYLRTSVMPPPPPPSFTPLTGRDDASPAAFALAQNYPNPFNPVTTIEFSLPAQSIVTLKVYNVLGQEVATLLNRQQLDQGRQAVDFNANAIPSGVYFYSLTMQDGRNGLSARQTRKMVVLK